MADHAKFSPSGASRWSECPGSMLLEQEYPDTSSSFADEGTAAHTLADMTFAKGGLCEQFVGERIDVETGTVEVTQDMADHVQNYVDFIRAAAKGKTLVTEQRVCFEQTLGLAPGEGFGTSDALIFDGTHLTVADLKFGRGVRVDAEENQQMMLYALGAIETFGDFSGPFETFTLVIHQPRIAAGVSVWHTDRARLEEFARDMRDSAAQCKRALAMSEDGLLERGFLKPSTKACQWCEAKPTCPALKRTVEETIGAMFEDLAKLETLPPIGGDESTPAAGDNYLSVAMAATDLIEDWLKAVRAEVERRLLRGDKVPGYKLVEGRAGDRTWTDAAEAEKLLKGFRLPQDDLYTRKLVGIPKIEKLLKESPARWEKVKNLIHRPQGKPSVAPDSDPRPAYSQPVFEDLEAIG